MSTLHILAVNLKRYRAKAGLTQAKLAEKAGLHRTYIGGIEQERINVSVKNLEKIASALEVEPSSLIFDGSSFIGCELEGDDDVTYAICSWEDGEMNAYPIEVKREDLTLQIVQGLVRQGLRGQELANAYDEISEEVLRLFFD